MRFERETYGEASTSVITSAFDEIDKYLQRKVEITENRIRRDNGFYEKGQALLFVLHQIDEMFKECMTW